MYGSKVKRGVTRQTHSETSMKRRKSELFPLVAVTVASARNKITVVRVVVVDCDRRVFSGVTDLLVVVSGTFLLGSSRVFRVGMMKRKGAGVSFLKLLKPKYPCAWGLLHHDFFQFVTHPNLTFFPECASWLRWLVPASCKLGKKNG